MIDSKYYRTGAEILLLIGLMISLGVNVVDKDEGYLPYTCDLENVPDMLCYKLSRVGETTGVNYYCYYDRDSPRKAKACKTGWKRLINLDDYKVDCPVDNTPYESCNSCCKLTDCDPSAECEVCLEQPTVEECVKYYGSSGGACSNTCETCKACPQTECIDCDKVDVIAYTDNGKYFCDDIGIDANCVRADDLSMPFG